MSQYSPMPPSPPVSYESLRHHPSAPSTVVNAVRIMIALTALSVVGLVVLFVNRDDLRDSIRANNRTFDSASLNNAVETALTVDTVLYVAAIVFFLFLAVRVRRGRNWARIVTWVIAGLASLGCVSNLAGTQATPTKVVSVVELVVYLALVVLLALRPSNDYFRDPVY